MVEKLRHDMKKMRAMVPDVQGEVIPRLSNLRYVPMRYRHILPLQIMKRYRCVVIGAAQGVLTVAVSDPQNTRVLEVLSKYTRRAIFPVWVEPVRMQLLIRRIERCAAIKASMSPRNSLSIASEVHVIMMLLMSQKKG